MRPKVIECGACGHPDYHCPASGCNREGCECEKFQRVTELELKVLERISLGKYPWPKGVPTRVTSQAIARLERKGCLQGANDSLTVSGLAVVKGTPPETLQSILGLVTETPPTLESLAALTRDQREELRDWAGREHLSASDNPVRRKPRPAWLDGLPKEVSHVGDV
jgi:hypothetical protein